MYMFIVNPTAGNGRGEKVFHTLKKSKLYQKIEKTVYVTAYKGHARKITEEIATYPNIAKIIALVVIGGDGTVHEVVNGLSNDHIPIAFIPAGSGNDFSRGVRLPKQPTTILRNVVEQSKEEHYWFGRAQSDHEQRTFVNCIGFGFDAYVVQRANRSTFKKGLNKIGLGRLIYVLSLLRELVLYKPFHVTIKTDDTTKTFERCFLLTVNNQPYFGGGMKINPSANNNPDYCSILIVDSISKWKVLFLFLTVFFGKHVHFKEVNIYRTKQVMIQTGKHKLYQIDGELDEAKEVHIKKQPFPLRIKGSI